MQSSNMEKGKFNPILPIILVAGVSFWLLTTLRGPTAASSRFTWEFPHSYFFHDDDEQRARHDVMLGKPMPPLELADWKGGEIDTKNLKGKVVVLDFWATWCGPCIQAFPHNNELSEKYQNQGVQFIGICTANGQENFASVLEKVSPKYPNARDANLSDEKSFQVMWYPTYAVIDRKGNVRAIGLSPDHLEDVLKKLVAEPAPPTTAPAVAINGA